MKRYREENLVFFVERRETATQALNLFRKLGDLTVDNKECYAFIQPSIQSKGQCSLAQPLARERETKH